MGRTKKKILLSSSNELSRRFLTGLVLLFIAACTSTPQPLPPAIAPPLDPAALELEAYYQKVEPYRRAIREKQRIDHALLEAKLSAHQNEARQGEEAAKAKLPGGKDKGEVKPQKLIAQNSPGAGQERVAIAANTKQIPPTKEGQKQ